MTYDDTIIDKLEKLWHRRASTASTDIPTRFLAVYDRGDNTQERYAVISDHPGDQHIRMAAIVERNNTAQVFRVNKIFNTEVDASAGFYRFEPIRFPDDTIYRSPIYPVECPGEKIQKSSGADTLFVVNTILKDPELSKVLLM
jgi:hypothetical protein